MAAGFDPSRAEEFADTLVNTGFLEKRENGYVIHDWDEYSGRFFLKVEAKREKDRKRLLEWRKAKRNAAETQSSQKSQQVEEIEETEEIEKIEEGEENSTESNNLENIGILSLVPNGCERSSDVSARKARARDTREDYSESFERL